MRLGWSRKTYMHFATGHGTTTDGIDIYSVLISEIFLERNGRLRMSEQARICEAELSIMKDGMLRSLKIGAVISFTYASLQDIAARKL